MLVFSTRGWEDVLVMRIVVCVKQVPDPDIPNSAFHVDSTSRTVRKSPSIPSIVNGFDENAVEAALRIKDDIEANIIVLSVGDDFETDVVKKPIAMGADELILIQDKIVANLDSFGTAHVIERAISKLAGVDLILCGRQASDWDNAQTPLCLAEMLKVPCVTTAKQIQMTDNGIIIHRVIPEG